MSTLNVNRIVDASGGVLAPISSVHRNRIINGDCRIDQRNAGASVTPTATVYALDRWQITVSQASKLSIQQSSVAPTGFVNSTLITSLSAFSVAAGDFFDYRQAIEGFNVADLGWGTANAATVTLSFWVRSSLTGTFGGAIKNSGGSRSYPFTYTISAANTWEQKSVTIAGDTTGTWLTTNGSGLILQIGLGVGTTFSGTAGAWAAGNFLSATGATSVVGTNGATFYITGVQLEKGTQATGFEYRQYTTELQLCQRYLPAFSGAGNDRLPSAGICASSSVVYMTINFPVNTRVPPTGISVSSASHFTVNVDGIVSSIPTSMAFTAPSSVNANRIICSGLTTLTSGQPAFLDISNPSGRLLFTGCEL